MVKTIVGVMVGYLAMVVVIMIVFTAAYKVMGAEVVFKPGVFEVSAAWITLSLVVSVFAALTGGYLSVFIAKNQAASRALAVVILIIGLIAAVMYTRQGRDTRPLVRTESEISSEEAMKHAREPLWLSFLNPLIGAAGVLIGGRFMKTKA